MNVINRVLKTTPRLIIGLLLFGASFMVAFHAMPIPKVSVEWHEDAPSPEERYIPAFKTTEGPEWALIYIGTSTCFACNVEYLPVTLERLKLLVQQKASAQGRTFVAVGVSVDWRVNNGVQHLEKMGFFDEIIVGRNWMNSGALKYMIYLGRRPLRRF